MQRISRKFLTNYNKTKDLTRLPLKENPIRILQFGEGNFLRAFIDWMIDEANDSELFNGNIAIVQPLTSGLINTLKEQDGLYTLLLRGIHNGQVIQKKKIITSVTEYINPYENWASLMKLAQSKDLRFVVSNTTEAGITYSYESQTDKCPSTFPAKLTAVMLKRFKTFHGSPNKGLIVLPCELIENNGENLKKCIIQHAQDWNSGNEFIEWINNDNYFLNTLVDRIVPGYPQEEAKQICEELGCEDKLIDTAEIFHLLVIEGPHSLKEELPLHKIGLNVIWTNDLSPYRTRKVSVLNGAHTSSVLAAYLAGLESVREMMLDDVFGKYIHEIIFNEICPVLDMPEDEKLIFANAVIERFLNPFIHHELISISLNSVSKWKVRVLPTVKKYLQKFNKCPKLLGFSLAALIMFYNGKLKDDYLTGQLNNKNYPIRDDLSTLQFFTKNWNEFNTEQNIDNFIDSILNNINLWGEDLTRYPDLLKTVKESFQSIMLLGTQEAALNILE